MSNLKSYNSRTFSVSDFLDWKERGTLVLAPKFQRRDVWTDKAKSYLIDTVICGKPMPKIFIRSETTVETSKTIREVVDGQQRLRNIFDYVADGFKISKSHNKKYGGSYFSDLPPDVQRDILEYEIAVDILLNMSDQDVLDVFARLNTYSVTLNRQELLNAQFFGLFKQTAYKLSREYYNFWIDNKIVSERKIVRMYEAELVSDLLVAMIEGVHSVKQLKQFYEDYDDEFPKQESYVKRFHDTMNVIGNMFDGSLASTEFHRNHLFYGLFCAVFHCQYGIPGMKVVAGKIGDRHLPRVRQSLDRVNQIFELEDSERSAAENKFFLGLRRATTDAPVRKYRIEFLCKLINKALS